jgi:hypothetical protein
MASCPVKRFHHYSFDPEDDVLRVARIVELHRIGFPDYMDDIGPRSYLGQGSPGIILEGYDTRQCGPSGTESVIIVRPPFPDPDDDTREGFFWHTTCHTCQAYIGLGNWCPCEIETHDHCASFFIRPSGKEAVLPQGIRVCLSCAPRILPSKIITMERLPLNGQVEMRNIAGHLVYSLPCHQLPVHILELVTSIKLALFDCLEEDPQITFFATNGYAYNYEQFLDYYGPHAKNQWRRAATRSFNIKMISQELVLTNRTYSARRLEWLASQNEGQPGSGGQSAATVQACLAFQIYIPAQLWPHEPIISARRNEPGQDGLNSWIQVHMGAENNDIGSVMEALYEALEGSSPHTRAKFGEFFPRQFVLAYRISSHQDVSCFLTEDANEAHHAAFTNLHRNSQSIQDLIGLEVSRLWTVAPHWIPGTLPTGASSTHCHTELCKLFPRCFRPPTKRAKGTSQWNLATEFPRETIHQSCLITLSHDYPLGESETEPEERPFGFRHDSHQDWLAATEGVEVMRCIPCGAMICSAAHSSRAEYLRHHSVQCFSGGGHMAPFWEKVNVPVQDTYLLPRDNDTHDAVIYKHSIIPKFDAATGQGILSKHSDVSIIGQLTLNDYLGCLMREHDAGATFRPWLSRHLIGTDTILTSKEQVFLPIGIQGRHGVLRVAILPGSLPLILGCDFCMQRKICWNQEAHTITFRKPTVMIVRLVETLVGTQETPDLPDLRLCLIEFGRRKPTAIPATCLIENYKAYEEV